MCALCARYFVTTDDVLEHLKEAHPSATLAMFARSLQDQPCLVHNGYKYRCSHRGKDNTHSWRCTIRGCPGSARTRGSSYLDVTSVVIAAGDHNHSGSEVKTRLFCAMNKVRQLADDTNLTAQAIRQKIFATLDPEVAAIFPSQVGIEKQVYRRRGKAKRKKCVPEHVVKDVGQE